MHNPKDSCINLPCRNLSGRVRFNHILIMRLPEDFRLFLLLSLVACIAGATTLPAQDRSAKRGVSGNNLNAEQVALLAPGISWIYNWGTDPGNLQLNGEIEYIPMVWAADQWRLDALKAYLDGGATPPFLFYSNEPNFELPLGSDTIPETAANFKKQMRQTLSEYNLPIIGPHMALGSAPEDSVTAYDACKDETITYTTMELYLDAFDCYLGEEPLEGIGVHPYGGIGELKWAVEFAYARYGKPVWVTEFAFRGVTDEQLYSYMLEALDFLERSPMVAGYAWFKADYVAQVGLQNVNLVTTGSRGSPIELTELGELYVNYPVYDPDYHHPVPGRFEAEAYHEQENLTMRPAYQRDGMGALYGGRGSGSISFRIDAAEAGPYRLRLRISSDFYSERNDQGEPGDTDPPVGQERDLFFNLELQAGQQILKVMLKGLNAQIDWLELEKAG